MMVSGELYSQDMNSLVHQYDSLHFQQHWPLNHQPLHSLIKKEPSDESDYFKKDKVLPLTPPGYMTDYQRNSEYDSSEYSNGVDYGDDRTSSDERECPDKVRTPPLSSLTPAVTLTEGMTPPGSSPDTTGALGEHASPDKHEQMFENGDSLKKLQMALQRNGLIYEEKLQCPMCDFNCSVRSSFNEHLLWHETKCSACDFTGDTRDALKEHMRAAHDVMSDDDHWPDDEPGLTTPKVNSQGKVKTFKCKQCEFSAVTKAEFWDHSKVHIKRDRILTCPKCPFITEYKHHLEYHLRNHFGSKPFKCDKCSYTCVNKSMLNSHLKSHSNVYQFRCADCTYATKYCHSLKLHLRKYGHGPAMVLNPDGSPNPLPIVDVYGTRRGPKQKGSGGPNNNNNNNNNNTVSESQQTSPSVPVFNPYSFIPTQLPYYSLLNSIPPFPFTPDQNEEKNNNIEKATGTEEDEEEPLEDKAPLDLTCPEPSNDSDNTQNNFDNPETPVTKNRRKGKAYKIEKVALRLTNEGEDDDEPEPKRLREEELVDLSRTARSPEVNLCEADSEQKVLEIKDDYNCTYCDISFKDIVMYTMHMGYHGYQDPFTCNMCGQQTADKVSFFLHIARTSHS